MKLLEGKNALIFGVANDHSIAWGIAQAMHAHGAKLAFSYAGPVLERRVLPLAEKVNAAFAEQCDVSQDDQIEALRQRFAGSPIKRAKRRGLLRNVAVALGNGGDPAAVPALARALSDDEPLVRGHAAWALGRIGTAPARRALVRALPAEQDGQVLAEIEAALRS